MSSTDDTTSPPCGHTNTLPDNDYAQRAYGRVAKHQLYFTWQNAFTQPNADTYTKQLVQERPDAKSAVEGKLGIVTGVTIGGAGYHMAEELALTAGMALILMGRNTKKLADAETKIKETAKKRGLPEPKLFHVKFDLDDLTTAVSAAKEAAEICKKGFDGKISVLVNNAGGNTPKRQLTKQGVEVNTGRNFLAPHKLTLELLPFLRAAKTKEYKPRVVFVASIGHTRGIDFDPARLLQYPDEGGAPEGFLLSSSDDNGEATTKTYRDGELMGAGQMYMYSKYAVVADAIALAKHETDVAFFSLHPGSIASNFGDSMGMIGFFYYRVFGMFQFSPSQGAVSTVRAALDPTLAEMSGSYLEAGGNPWPPRDPSGVDPKTGEMYEIGAFAEAVFDAANKLCQKLLPDKLT